ncbi:MAG: DUF1080 domain-containing protein [Oscillospiraceae bacterium]|jgi:hypothetical protein|nr:DUF1080 domain-containing protein [Oscillospiraceae bacterium]
MEILFDGTSLDNWTRQDGEAPDWAITDGCMTVGKGNIVSKAAFGDARLHVEFRIPAMPWAKGQDKGNSGVYLQGRYEIQVLDSYGVEEPTHDDCAAIYNLAAPRTNACLPAEEWQSYDIIFRAPRFADGAVTEPARLTLIQNGVVVHNNLILSRCTPGGVSGKEAETGPLLLQDHGNPVSFRNIWLEAL